MVDFFSSSPTQVHHRSRQYHVTPFAIVGVIVNLQRWDTSNDLTNERGNERETDEKLDQKDQD